MRRFSPFRVTPLLLGLSLTFSASVVAQPVSDDSHLPPAPAWQGRSLQLVLPPDHPWVTPFEASGLQASPNYEETVRYLKRLTSGDPALKMISLGRSPEGRDIWAVVACLDRVFTSHQLRFTRKPLLFAQAGIHSGEIDGKDAGLMLLRDITARGTKRYLLSRVNILFVPIFNVDGHERSSPRGRINQRGPAVTGWRTNSRNLNLNRDYAKIDSLEMQHMIRALGEWQPDLYVDLHVTDGVDYQYDITYGFTGSTGLSPSIASWLTRRLTPNVNGALKAWGHIPGPLIFAMNDEDLHQGIAEFNFDPRFSNGYGDLRHLPTILVENHSLKPYLQRVLGTYIFLEECVKALGRSGPELREAIQEDRARRPQEVPLSWKPDGSDRKIDLLGIDWTVQPSDISGGDWIQWLGEPKKMTIPYLSITAPNVVVPRPKAYWIPPAWDGVIQRLTLHGVQYERLQEPRTVKVTMDRIVDYTLASQPFEGRVRVTAQTEPEVREETFAVGSLRVSTDQPLGSLVVHLLEPQAPDSFFQWGFFHEIFQRTEYVEAYAMIPLARAMLAEDPALKTEFEKKLESDEAFASDPQARLLWLYRRSGAYDERHMLYPIAREF